MSEAVEGHSGKTEIIQKATGRAVFVSDMALPGMLHGKILRSPHAHARILQVDVTQAKALSGVRAIITGEDVRKLCKPYGPVIHDEVALHWDKVRYVGDEVAAVAAVSEEIAEKAIQLIKVQYEPLEAVFDGAEALEPGAPQLHAHAKNNLLDAIRVRVGDIERGLKEADLVVERGYGTSRVTATPFEPHAAVASCDPFTRQISLWTASQAVFHARHSLSRILGIPENHIRVLAPHVGGAFGHKVDGIYSNDVCAIILSMKTGRPVRIVLNREEETTATRTRHVTKRHLELGLSKDGMIVAIREKIICDTGAYASFGPGVAWLTAITAPGPYKIPNVEVSVDLVYTNNPAAGAFRGFGNPQATFSRESLLDEAAERLGIDPLELRLRNVIRREDLPFVNSTGQIIRTCGVSTCLEEAARKVGYSEKGDMKGSHVGFGLATMIHWSGSRWAGAPNADCSSAMVVIAEDGTATVYSGLSEMGQGTSMGLARIAAEELGLRIEDVQVIRADTEMTPLCLGAWGSRGAVIAGSAVKIAAEEAKRQVLEAAAEFYKTHPEDFEIKDSVIRSKVSADRGLSLKDLANHVYYSRKAGEPRAIIGKGSWDAPTVILDERGGHYAPNYAFSAVAVKVKVDPETGRVAVLDIASAHDVGKAIDREAVEGQIQGGVCQGLGYALFENMFFDKMGHSLNPSFLDYIIPTMADLPDISAIIVESGEDREVPTGVKGVGETGLVCVAAAIANAVYDAVGVRITDLPLTAEKIALAISKKGKRKDS